MSYKEFIVSTKPPSLEELDTRVKHLEDNCCSMDALKTNIKTQMLVESLVARVDALSKQQKTTTNFMYVVTGIWMAFQFLQAAGFLTIPP